MVQSARKGVFQEGLLGRGFAGAQAQDTAGAHLSYELVYLILACLGIGVDYGSVSETELKHVMNKKKAFIVTDSFLFKSGFTKLITDSLD